MKSNRRQRVQITSNTSSKIERAGYYFGLAVVGALAIVAILLLLALGAWAALWIISHFPS